MGSIYDDLPGHEGFALHEQQDSSWVAACSCGWRDDHGHPDAEGGYEAAVDRWDALHASPLLEQTVPGDVVELVGEAQRAVAELARRRPRAAATALDGISRWCAARRRTAGIETGGPTVRERLDALVDRARADDRRLGR